MSVIQNKQAKHETDDIEIGKIFGILIDSRWLILSITFVFSIIGIAYALLATPIYNADALIQVEKKSSGVPALGDMGELFAGESSSSTEIEIISSRMILGKTVDKLNLTTVTTPNYFPVIGKGLSRIKGDEKGIELSRFEIPSETKSRVFQLEIIDVDSGKFEISDSEENVVLSGKVGELAQNGEYKAFVAEVSGNVGDSFTITKRSRLAAIQWLQHKLTIIERGKQTGILQLTFSGEQRDEIETILNDISNNYLLQNVERNSAEAESSLNFLRNHLPGVKAKLMESEDSLNLYRQQNESIDLGLEAKATLDVMVKLEAQLNELTFKESEISQRFTKEHPNYIALLDKREVLLNERKRFNSEIQKLPKTQREILRLTRDVEVNQQIYIQLLNKVQELNILKASTVGNVRILDNAQSINQPIKPKKPIIVVLSTLIGGMFAVILVFTRNALHRGVENPDEIEALGIPVYASIPMSDWQIELEKKYKGKGEKSVSQTLLAESNPADLSIEALRSLRTSLHFAMMEAKNNILMISGPSPSIGKSFVSANMAAVIAKSNQKVLLIDADMRKGCMEKQMAVKSKPGLSEYLCGQVNVFDLVKQPGVEGLDFIPRGEVPPNPSELLMHPRFKELMSWASENYDIVIVDTPPILAVTDPAIVGAHAGTTLIIGRFGQNSAKEIEITNQRFAQNGIEVKGFILNAVVRKASSYYGGNYGYYNYSYDSQSK